MAGMEAEEVRERTGQRAVPAGARLFEGAGVEMRDVEGVEVESLQARATDGRSLAGEEHGLDGEEEVEEERDNRYDMHVGKWFILVM